MKSFLIVTAFVVLHWNYAISQNSEPDSPLVEVTSTIENDKLFFLFENQRNFESIQKLESFTDRIKNLHSEEVEAISFLREQNSFKIEFKSKSPSEKTIENILTHFKVNNYEIK